MAKQKKENSFENNLQRIEEIIEKINNSNLPLEEAITLHTEASELIKQSEEYLQKVSMKLETLQ